MSIRFRSLLRCAAAVVLTAAAVVAAAQPPSATAYVGSTACATCHPKAYDAWRGSQHQRAMQEANASTVLGNFADARFTLAGATTRFFRRDGRYFVNTEGPDGKPADFEILYTFGVEPLQQYLVALPGGRLQALGVAWDSRPRAQGGQRWFHLYAERKPGPGDPLHWTGIDQTWNYQCADCHSTDVRKNYDAATRSYRTTWSEVSVGCEACHGPGSRHVAWAKGDAAARSEDASKGLAVALDDRRGVSWPIDPATGTASRSRPRASSAELDACARCHARRGQFSDAWHPGRPLGDAYRVSLIEPGLYYPDGQVRDEVYDHGSFLQSRMHARGVVCSDCHDPHTQKLRAAGNAVCGQCHAPARFDTEAHHHHKPGSSGAACAACHLPTTTYMVVDPRHDHSIRIPRPDRTVALGTPNACNGCHAKQTAKWATVAVARWAPQRKPGFQTWAEALAAGDRRAPGASSALAAVVDDPSQPAFARASAIARLPRNAGPETLRTLERAFADSDPLVRAAAVRAVSEADPVRRARLLPRLLADPVREVRMDAARGLVGEPEAQLGADDRRRLARALDEHAASLRFNADRPEAQAEMAALEAARGRFDAAIDAYRTALALDPTFAPASVNLADLYRSRGQERDSERVLADAIRADPRAAAPRHALGLSLVRQKRTAEALATLGEAAKLAPEDPRYTYVYGVALHDAGRRADAIRTLNGALARHPYDREILFALVGYEREAGDVASAAKRAKLLAELVPGDPGVARLARELDTASAKKAGAKP